MITLLSVLDFCGTFVFAISGAAAGVRPARFIRGAGVVVRGGHRGGIAEIS